jgi:DNA helicase IV
MRADEKSIQQAYVDWVYRLLKRRIADVEGMASESAALNDFWEFKQKRLEGLRRAEVDGSLVMGCLDMVDGDAWYIGTASVDGQGDREVALIEWQTPIGELFFQADRYGPGGVGRRLTFTMSQRRVNALAEDVLTPGFKLPETELAVAPPPSDAPSRSRLPRALRKTQPRPAPPVEAPASDIVEPDDGLDLRARDLLLDELEREHTGHMHEVIATIQADQDRLVRRATERVTVVQGGPGTGKTIVGLHRAAWVLYQQRNRRLGLQNALVIGPNRAFVDYIDAVLPQLGETTAVHLSLADVALLDLPDTERARLAKVGVADEKAQRVKGDLRMVGFVSDAVWAHAAPGPISLSFGGSTLSLTKSQVAKIIAGYRQAETTYDGARQRLANDVVRALLATVEKGNGRDRGRGADRSEKLTSAAQDTLRRLKWVDAVLPPVIPRVAVRRALADPARYQRIAKRHLTATQRAVLSPQPKVRWTWTESDLPLIAEAAHVVTGGSQRFGHVVVDEAQDLSPMQWRLIARRSSSQSMTILGDLAQATTVWAPKSWMAALTAAGLAESATVGALEVGYRVPKEVMELAGRLLPEIANGVAVPQSVRSGAAPVAYKVPSTRVLPIGVARLVEALPSGSVGVIAADAQVEAVLKALVKMGLDAGRGSSDGLSHRITVLDSATSKGLEFEHVVVAEPAAIAGRSAREKRRLFVALTRATKTLTIVHANLLPVALRGHIEDREFEVGPPARASKPHAPAKRSSETKPRIAAPSRPDETPAEMAPTAGAKPEPPEPPVAAPIVVPPAPAAVQVRTRGLRRVAIRVAPAAGAHEVERVRGILTLMETSGDWARVRTPAGGEGWAASRELRL